MKVREVALDCLSRIMLQKSYSHIDLDHTLKTAPLNEKDKALLTNIVYGTLQHANLLKWEISLHIKNDKTHPKMMILLMMSLYQMRYLDKILKLVKNIITFFIIIPFGSLKCGKNIMEKR